MARHTAWEVLRSGSPTPLRNVDAAAERAGLDPRDRALARRLVGCEVRQRGTLRALVARFARGKPSADLATHLRLGLVQLFLLDRIPPHAAVSETVRAVADTLGLAKARAANAVLREALRARRAGSSGDARRDLVGRPWHFDGAIFRDPNEHPLLWMEDALSLPAQLGKRWVARLTRATAERLAREALAEPPLSIVVLEGEREMLAAELEPLLGPTQGQAGEEGAHQGTAGENAGTLRRASHPTVLLAPASATEALLASAAFAAGRITVQGATALRAAELVAARAGERVLDLCAAPGGKGALLARAGASVLSLDLSPARLARLPAGYARLAPRARFLAAASDGTAAVARDARFDAVLLDAPCTNTGVLAARPEAKWRFGPAGLKELALLQARLLDEAAERVRPGGRLVYSTCSLEPEEGERVVRAFLDRRPSWGNLADEALDLPDPEGGGPIDGGYRARLERAGP